MQTAKRILTVLLAMVLVLACAVFASAEETKTVQIWNTSGKMSEHATVSDALAVYSSANQYVKLTADITEDITLESDLYLDLNGHTLSGSLNLNGHKLYGMDTTTDGYDAASAGALTATITGGAPELAGISVTGRRYLAVASDNGYAFHRIYLSITNVSLDTANVGFGYKAEFYGDATVQAQIKSVGYKLQLGEYNPISRDTAFKNQVTLRLKNYDVAKFGSTPVHAVATVTLTSGQVLESAEQAYSMQTMLELLNDKFDNYSGTQKRAVRDMANSYTDAVADWDIPNILGYKTFYMAEKAGGIASYDEAAGTITATGKDNTKFFLKPSATESYARNWKVTGTITKTEDKSLFFSFGVKDSTGKIQWFCVYRTGLSRQNTWNWANTYYAPDEQYVFTNRPSDFFYNRTLTYGGDKLHYELVLHDDVLKMYFGNDQEPTTLAWQLPLTEELWGGFAVDSEYQVGFYSVDPCVFVNAVDNVVTNNDADKFQVAATTGAISYDKTAGTITAAGTGNTSVTLKPSATEDYARNWKVTGKITKTDVTKNLFFSFGLIDENGKEQWFCVYKEGLARQRYWNWANTYYAPDEEYVFTNSCTDWFYYKTAYTGGDMLTYTIEVQNDVLKAYFGNKHNEKTLAWQLPLTEELWGGFATDSQYQFCFNSVDPCQFEISSITVETDNTPDALYIAKKSDNLTVDGVNGTIASNYDPATTDATNTEIYLGANGAGGYAKTWEMTGTVTKLEASDNFYLSFGVRNAAGKNQWFCIRDAGLARQRYYNWADTYTTADGEHVFFNQAACSFYWKEANVGSDKLYYKLALDGDILKVYFGSDYYAMHLAWCIPLTEDTWGDFVPGDYYQIGITTVDPCAFEITDIQVTTANVANAPAKLHKVENIQIRDPYILVDNGTYYMYGTRSFGKLDVFTSTDLGVWTELAPAFEGGAEFWGDAAGSSEVEGKLAAYWAPEVFKYEGAYYMFASFTKDEEAMNQQAVVILKSDSPAGPFTVWSEDTRGYKGAVTPADHSCIDGTLYIENGVPYMIYVHQHQCTNEACNDGMGSMAYVQLSADLKSTVGNYIECFDASDLDWISTLTGNAPTVTDGPEVYTAADGQKYLLWSTHWDGDYCQIASPFNSLSQAELFTAVVQNSTKIFPDTSDGTDVEVDGGHGMIFTDLDGNDVLVLHGPNASKERALFFDVTASASSISVAQRTITTPNTPTGTVTPKYYYSATNGNCTPITSEGQYVSSPTAQQSWITLQASADHKYATNWELSGVITKGQTSKNLFFSIGLRDEAGNAKWFCIYNKGLARQHVWNWADTYYAPDGQYVIANPASEHFFYKTAALGGQELYFTFKLEGDVLRAYFGNSQYEKTLAWELPVTEELWGGFAEGTKYEIRLFHQDPCQYVISDMEVITSGY